MIKFNVITNNSKWLKYIKNPDRYLNTRISKLNNNSKKFIKNKFFCTLLLSGDNEIKNLIINLGKKNKITDVLSFPFQTKKELKKILKKERKYIWET